MSKPEKVYIAVAFRDGGGVESTHGDLAEVRCWAGTMASLGWKVFGAVVCSDGTRTMVDLEEAKP